MCTFLPAGRLRFWAGLVVVLAAALSGARGQSPTSMPALLDPPPGAPRAGLAPAAPAAGDVNLRDLVEEVLDQNVPDVEIAGQPVAEALEQLGRKTGLRFALTPEAVAWMPYGERTRVMCSFRACGCGRGCGGCWTAWACA